MGRKILIVDDEPDIRLVLKTVLENGGFDVSLAANGYNNQSCCLHKFVPISL